MIDLIKWFWANISFRNWTFEGCELANPFKILWKLVWAIPVYLSLAIFCIIIAIFHLDYKYFADTWENNT